MSDSVTPPPRPRPDATTTDPTASRAKDHSFWNWLLFVPIVVPLMPALFNADSPRFLGFPRFYWLQLAYILLGVATTTLVYQMTKKRGGR
ncbi:DUF3311 domain-containing protein [Micromonospora sp. KC721]|uniref:DUF3311 domain-containing protein n=1 Tax=Micromonospora sp. KC721 TaxID=2530380 RepID=UPI00104909C3|nr:DUF3311 domain-containing protein [Micromonospora sp. KC721]TDB79056.1 DUF3311 domain-containing protein [Micromonospora sp. KC721]